MNALAAAPVCTGPHALPCLGVLAALTAGGLILGMSASSHDIDDADETPPGTLADGDTTDCVGQCSPEECARLGQEIESKATALSLRLEDMVLDPLDLYRRALRIKDNFGKGSWEGHKLRYNRDKEELTGLIAIADSKNCPVSDFARDAASEEPPDKPFGQ